MKQTLPVQSSQASPPVLANPMPSLANARIAIVHYWFVSRRGGEHVVEAMAGMFPQADLFSLVADPQAIPDSLARPFAPNLFPPKYSWQHTLAPPSSSALSPGIGTVRPQRLRPRAQFRIRSGKGRAHLVWDLSRLLLPFADAISLGFLPSLSQCRGNGLVRKTSILSHLALPPHVGRGLGQSRGLFCRQLAKRRFPHPQTLPQRFRRHLSSCERSAGYLAEKTEDYYLLVGQLVDYKRADLAITACTRLGRRLHVVGAGEEYARLRKVRGTHRSFLRRSFRQRSKRAIRPLPRLVVPG